MVIPKAIAIMKARDAFVTQYCREQNWPSKVSELTIDQILEIRKHPEWKNPNLEGINGE